ncbi:MAG TPA: cob(I)yrinic acid a,c-diamide adenosyltransferase [Phycisphaerae bacterium]|nr:cob(I)yrinic acid a,c-diamide adenosyltransferase [Phycisphaerae bacterium]HNU45375.1 cob(I)yrinic acid a,c-diamide adenosyltransferase [Phycisphaerae bacterium]
MKLYTRSGDGGETGLYGGARVLKCHLRIAACGDVDETNAALGLVLAAGCDAETGETIRLIQRDLFSAGAELADIPAGGARPTRPQARGSVPVRLEDQVARLEQWIDAACAEAGPLRHFVLPGGTAAAAALHAARTVCRRAERSVVALAQQEPVARGILAYLNRLSDLLFALARRANHRAGTPDILWSGPAGSQDNQTR